MAENELTKIIGSKNILDSEEVLEEYSKDLSLVPRVRPRCVVKPANADEVQAVVKWANETLTTLVPVSSGAPHSRGDTVPSTGGAVIVDLNNMKQIVLALLQHYEEKQQWPDGLDELLPALENNRAVFENPVTGDNPGYEYVKPSGSLEEIKSAETIVLYQLRNGQRDASLAAAYLDGQVPED